MNIAELSTRMNVELESVNEWLSNNSSSVNVGKTKCMAIGKSRMEEAMAEHSRECL